LPGKVARLFSLNPTGSGQGKALEFLNKIPRERTLMIKVVIVSLTLVLLAVMGALLVRLMVYGRRKKA